MRGGAIPLAAWGTLLLILFIGNWIWDAKAVNAATAAFAAVVIFIAAGLLTWRAGRLALSKGGPEPDPVPEAVPRASSGAALIALSTATIVFGLEFASFLIYFGAGLLVLSVARLAVELRAERATRERVLRGPPR